MARAAWPIPAAMVVVCCAAALAGCRADSGRRVPLAVGDTISGVVLSGSRPALVWVFEAAECLGCSLTDPARSVRALQRRYGDRFETVVLAVSELGVEDQGMVGRFLEAQRISARVAATTPAEHERNFGAGSIPAFYLVDSRGVVEAVQLPPPDDSLYSGGDSSTGNLIQQAAENWLLEKTG